MTVIVVPQGDVLRGWASVKEGLDVLEEPRLVPATNFIEFVELTGVNHVSSHDHGSVFAKDQTLYKLMSLFFVDLVVDDLHGLVPRVGRAVVEFDKALGWNHFDLDRGQESKGAVRPGNGIKEI